MGRIKKEIKDRVIYRMILEAIEPLFYLTKNHRNVLYGYCFLKEEEM
jgi:hypothetical protein